MNEEKYLDLISKYLSGNIAPAERQVLIAWADDSEANRQFFDEMVNLWDISGNYSVPDESFEANIDQAWQQLEPRLDERPNSSSSSATIVHFSNRKFLWRVAAAIALLISLGLGWNITQSYLLPVTVEVATLEQQRDVVLPDGSEITLNAHSGISYQKAFKKRSVELTGEAFFDVAHDPERPFEITAGSLKTTVLGTSFNIRAYPEEETVEVSVQSGKVRVAVENSEQPQTAELEAGKTVCYSSSKKALTPSTTANPAPWIAQKLVFEGTPFRSVIEDMKDFYAITITVSDPSILNCTLNAEFSRKQALTEVFEIINFSTDLTITEQTNGSYLISGKGCN